MANEPLPPAGPQSSTAGLLGLRRWWRRFVRRHIVDDDPMDDERMRHDPAYRERKSRDEGSR